MSSSGRGTSRVCPWPECPVCVAREAAEGRGTSPDYGDRSQVRAYRDRSGMGETKCVDVGNVRVWTWSHAMDGPCPPEAERLFEALEGWITPRSTE